MLLWFSEWSVGKISISSNVVTSDWILITVVLLHKYVPFFDPIYVCIIIILQVILN